MSNLNDGKAVESIHPGYYIADIIEDMEISKAEFAAKMGMSVDTLEQLLDGKIGISDDFAKKLSTEFGTSVEVWKNLQKTYGQKYVEASKADSI